MLEVFGRGGSRFTSDKGLNFSSRQSKPIEGYLKACGSPELVEPLGHRMP